MEPGEI